MNKKQCDKCSGNAHPIGEYCGGCNMKEYRRNKSRKRVRNSGKIFNFAGNNSNYMG